MTSLKHTTAGIVLAFGALAAAHSAATAGGDAITYGSGIARHRVPAAVPVPAPAPVPDTISGYYIRVDAAYSQSNLSKYRATDPLADTFRGDSYLDNFPRYGLGAGYQFSKWLRMDVTFDWRNDVTSRGSGSRDYTIANTAGGVNALLNPLGPIAMRDTVSDGFTSSNMTGLINAYLEQPMTPSFTPYLGFGVGFVRHQLKGRSYTKSTTCVDANDCDPTLVDGQAASTVDSSQSAIAGGTDYSLAAAVMAGFSYKIWDNTKLDLGYRFLHLQGTNFIGRNATTVENLRIPDQSIHELRAGVRFDIN